MNKKLGEFLKSFKNTKYKEQWLDLDQTPDS